MNASEARAKANHVKFSTPLYQDIEAAIVEAAETGLYSIQHKVSGLTEDTIISTVDCLREEGFIVNYYVEEPRLLSSQSQFSFTPQYYINISWREYCED